MIQLIPIALISGVLTVFSPCVLPILPIILTSGIDGNRKRVNGVIAGLVLSFTAASLFLSAIITALGVSADDIRNFAAFLIFIIGLAIIFPIWDKIQFYLEKFVKVPQGKQGNGFGNGFLTGVGLGVAWTPCVGPIVAAMSTLTALSGVSVGSLFLVLSYATGLGIPLIFIARGGSKIMKKMKSLKTNPDKLRKIFGVILVATSLFIYVGFEKKIQAWFLDVLPENWTNLSTNFEEKLNTREILKRNKDNMERDKKDSDVFYKVDPEDIVQGCLGGFDCIPSIDNPKFESVSEANIWLKDEDRVFGVNYNGVQKAYPQKIMNWHEIVNDNFGNEPVAVTFCPLCGTGVSFLRKVDGSVVEFGVSGKLYNSDLIMYDRTDEQNYWQQATGEAIKGPAARRDEKLEQIVTTTTTWKKWKDKYPETLALSRETGFNRNYSNYPYGNYEQSDDIMFEVENIDDRFHKKAVVLGINIGDKIAKAYLVDDLKSTISAGEAFIDNVGEYQIEITRDEADTFSFTREDTNEKLIPLRSFWFAWNAFNPDTLVFSE